MKVFSNLKSYPFTWVVLLVLASVACMCGSSINESERGIKTSSGEFKEVMNPGGPYWDTDYYSSLTIVDVSVQKTSWNDPDLVSKDLQPIGLALNVDYRRPKDEADLQYMWENYNREAQDDDELKSRVESKIFTTAKNATAQLTVQQMLGTESVTAEQRVVIAEILGKTPEEISTLQGRDLLEFMIVSLLSQELNDSRIEVVAVTVDNVAPTEEFLKLLERGANAKQEQEVLRQEEITKRQELANAQAQSAVDEEIARRNAEITRIEGEAWENSPGLLALRLAEIYADAIQRGDTIIFVPEGSSIANVISPGSYTPEEIQATIDQLNLEADQE